jgi:hypothetical protein
MPLPPAMFSPLAMTRSILRSRFLLDDLAAWSADDVAEGEKLHGVSLRRNGERANSNDEIRNSNECSKFE